MLYLIVALAVLWIVKTVKLWVDAPAWVWQCALPVVALLVLLPWDSEQWEWYSPVAIAGIVSVLQGMENYLLVRTDEGIFNITRRR